jgi:CheY-specific phosphatase CheX
MQDTAPVTAERQPPTSAENLLHVDHQLLSALIAGTRSGLEMTGIVPEPVGASRLTQARHAITVMVGLVGKHSGNMALNLSEVGMMFVAGRLLGTPVTELNEDSIDAIMEVGNMIGGAIKGPLRNTGYAISNISLPSLIFGRSVSMVYARGIKTVSVEFEICELPFNTMNDRFFSTTISLLQGSGA